MPTVPETRQENFDRAIEDYDAKALNKCVDFDQHRYITVERDGYTANHYVKGHKTLRGACDYLAQVREEGEPFVPEQVLDLDTAEQFELDVLAFVAPKQLDAVAVMLPRELATQVLDRLVNCDDAPPPAAIQRAINLFRSAIARR